MEKTSSGPHQRMQGQMSGTQVPRQTQPWFEEKNSKTQSKQNILRRKNKKKFRLHKTNSEKPNQNRTERFDEKNVKMKKNFE